VSLKSNSCKLKAQSLVEGYYQIKIKEVLEGMDFYDVISTRRSIRSYSADAIPEEVLQRVMKDEGGRSCSEWR
jgi:hypothetical protein